jgi:hypothetical protein
MAIGVFHCPACEVSWARANECFCCGRRGVTGRLATTLVEPARPITGWRGPLDRPGAYRSGAYGTAVTPRATRSLASS